MEVMVDIINFGEHINKEQYREIITVSKYGSIKHDTKIIIANRSGIQGS